MSKIKRYKGNPAVYCNQYMSRWTSGTYRPGNAMVAFRFDDGMDTDYTWSYPQMTSHGMTAGFALITSMIGTANRMTLAQDLEMQAAGMEIMDHSATSPADPTSVAQFVRETVDSVKPLRAKGFDVPTFTQPGTWVVDDAYNIIDTAFYGTPGDLVLRANYLCYQAYIFSLSDANYMFTLPMPAGARWGGSYIGITPDTFTLAHMKQTLDVAIVAQKAVMFLLHAYALDTGGYNTRATISAFFDYVQLRVNQGYLSVVTPTQLFFANPVGTQRNKMLALLDQEPGDLSQWTSQVDVGGNITVTVGAALNSSGYGISVNIPNNTARYTQKTFTTDTTGKVRVRFFIDPNTLMMTSGDTFWIFMVLNAASAAIFYIYMIKSGANWQLKISLLDNGGIDHLGTATTISDAPHWVEVYVTRATTNVSSDGTLTWWIDTLDTPINSITGVDNYTKFADFTYLRAGALAGIDAGTSGAYFIDEIIVNDTGLAIGATP